MIASESAPFFRLSALERGLHDNPDRATEKECRPLLEELSVAYAKLVAERARQPAVFQPGGEWAVHVQGRGKFYEALEHGDISGVWRWLKDFWRNPLGVIVKQYATFERLSADRETREKFARLMARDYVVWSNLLNESPQALAIPSVGNPWGYSIDDVVIAPKAMRYHVLATQARQVLSDVAHPVIAEIGAGYGGVAHYLSRGEAPVTYLDFDLPETLILAAYYLKRTLPHREVRLVASASELTQAVLAENAVVLAPNWAIPLLPDRSVDLFLNTFSLSEMPLSTIEEYVRHIERTCRGYFLHNNMDRAGVVNAGSERVPCSRYPISEHSFKLLYRRYDLFQDRHSGRDGDYRELLYQRIGLAP